ncbi:hypothetical protein CLV98_101238 [Dyadobacter jejuensis]|uniref:Uncharacterized protein n=1 Tax=Dyadobacter jejuensis TaxID=1082580 RepID=A0A316AR24_9BACT|nr:hypothetical protein [Dyadobacter jejuensis]PWJ60062.1 hypothetical protein CLV98_101238 [Dyadobacter jejuensis]
MFQLNPHGLADAWWQHLLMVVVAVALGYMIGYRSGAAQLLESSRERFRLNNILDHCKKTLSNTMTPKPIAEDLKLIEGIGPKIEELLQAEGIVTFADLAGYSEDKLKAILENAGSRFQMHDPQTWPQQAQLAHDGKWEELKAWQDRLLGGKEMS